MMTRTEERIWELCAAIACGIGAWVGPSVIINALCAVGAGAWLYCALRP